MELRHMPTTVSRWIFWACLSACVSPVGVARAQDNLPQSTGSLSDSQSSKTQQSQANGSSGTEGTSEQQKPRRSRGSFVIAPLPISSPALGTGIIPIVGYIFPFRRGDTVSPPSVVGVAGLATNNDSRGFAAYADLYMKEKTYRVTAGYVRGTLNYDLYGVGLIAANAGQKLPLSQSGQVLRAEALRQVGWDFFLGLRFWTGGSDVVKRSTSDTSTVTDPSDLGLHTTLRALGLRLNRETTDNRFHPTRGTLLDFTSDFFSQSLGSKYTFQSYRFTFNKYLSISEKQILAYNVFVCGTGGAPPFYANCIYGASNELRGYTAGRYIDRYMFATQLEYRLSLPKRFGLVGFGGIGEVVPGASEALRSNHLLPGGGGGVRFQLSKVYRVNMCADFARGKDTWTWSMGVGEAF